MRRFKQFLFIIFLLCLCQVILSSDLYAWRWSRPKKTVRERVKATRRKAYRYKKVHDVNNDGKVNIRDRLMWLKRKNKSYTPVLVSDENEDIVEVMDMDGDGSVEEWEMEGFYNQYDLNGNGTLEDVEIEAAADANL